MGSELLNAILEFLKLAPRYLVSVAIVSGVVLFFPDSWIDRVGLLNFSKEYRQWLGLTFLISTTLWGGSVVSSVWVWIQKNHFKRTIQQQITKKLNSLTEDEKQILRYYFAKNTRANMLKIDDGVVQELVSEQIIYRSASVGNLLEGFAHNITDFAWDYISSNSHVLNGTTNFYRTDKMERDW